MEKKKRVVANCPVCDSAVVISRLRCPGCDAQIDSDIPVPAFFCLPDELQQFVLVFLRCRGNIREVEKELGISYPTVCKRLDTVNELLRNQPAGQGRLAVLEQLERGEINAKEAAKLLRGR